MKGYFVIICSCIVIIRGADWTYEYETSWPEKCRAGIMQSPINIVTKEALTDKYGAHIRGPLVLRGYGNVKLRGLNNGHTLKWQMADESKPPMVSGGPLRGNYSFAQFHLHWMSEHAIDGFKYPLEIHMVHVKTGLSRDEALSRPDGLAVIGIMSNIVVEKAAHHALDQLMEDVSQLLHSNSETQAAVTLDLTRLFSPEMQSYYTYHGSLTTPNCDEVVTWIVMDKPIDISDVQYKVISRADVGGINNYRSLQPTNRVVYKSAYSCATTLSPSFAGFLTSIASCLTKNFTGVVSKGFCVLFNLKKRIFGTNSNVCAVS